MRIEAQAFAEHFAISSKVISSQLTVWLGCLTMFTLRYFRNEDEAVTRRGSDSRRSSASERPWSLAGDLEHRCISLADDQANLS